MFAQSDIDTEIDSKLPTGKPGGIPAVDLRTLLHDVNSAVFQIPQPGGGGGGSGGLNMKYKTAAYTAIALDEILADTSAGPWTLTLPPTATQLDKIVIKDAKGTWVNNNLTLARNGNNIAGVADNLICDVTQNITLIYIDTTTGWGVF